MNYLETIFDLIFPKGCINCGKYGIWLCNECHLLFQGSLPECFYCRRVSNENKTHLNCLRNGPLKSVNIIWQYNDLAHKLMSTYKYEGIRELSLVIAGLSKARFTGFLDKIGVNPILTVIPLSKNRKENRGFNQTDLIAQNYSLNSGEYCPNLLIRKFDNENQAHLSRELRLLNIEDIFSVNEKIIKSVDKDRPVIIFDDVVTTGSTLNEAARCLEINGFTDIHGFALFRGKPKYKS